MKENCKGTVEIPSVPGDNHSIGRYIIRPPPASLYDRRFQIDNNGAERSLRGVAVGRKNWLFFGSDNGGRTAAILTSFIITCKRLDIDPFAYLRDIFARISAHPQNRLEELLPDRLQAVHKTASV